MARTNAAQYYVRINTCWQNSSDYFVGPFVAREQAQAAIDGIETEDNVWLSTELCGGDLCSVVRVYPKILTATEAKRSGMRDDYSARHNVVPQMPSHARDLFEMITDARGAM